MGAWGTGIFSNDTAADVRDSYRELLGEGQDGPEATRVLLEEYSEDLDDPDASPDLWLGLAATQWKVGRLEEDVKTRALELINSGAEVRRWEDLGASAGEVRRRSQAVRKLRDQLVSPQRAPVRIRPTRKETTDFEEGDVFSYRLGSGPTVLFRVLEIFVDGGGEAPVVGLLDWTGEAPPRDTAALGSLPLKTRRFQGEVGPTTYLLFGEGKTQYPRDRIEVLVRGVAATEPGSWEDHALDWGEVDEEIEKRLGLRADPTDTPFSYSLEYSRQAVADKAVEDLRAGGFRVELGGANGPGQWFVRVASETENAAAERELQSYATRTEGRLYLP